MRTPAEEYIRGGLARKAAEGYSRGGDFEEKQRKDMLEEEILREW